jgi:hypothetical protein
MFRDGILFLKRSMYVSLVMFKEGLDLFFLLYGDRLLEALRTMIPTAYPAGGFVRNNEAKDRIKGGRDKLHTSRSCLVSFSTPLRTMRSQHLFY